MMLRLDAVGVYISAPLLTYDKLVEATGLLLADSEVQSPKINFRLTPNKRHFGQGWEYLNVTHSRSTSRRQQGEERLNDLWFVAMTILAAIASDSVLDAAFAWLCNRRRDYPDSKTSHAKRSPVAWACA